jgi:hypothetical protein
MFETLGDDAEGKGLDMSDGLVPSAAVAQDAGQVRNLSDPAAIVLAFELDRKGQTHAMHCNTAEALVGGIVD